MLSLKKASDPNVAYSFDCRKLFTSDAKNVIVCDEGWIDRLVEENKRRGSLPPLPPMSLDNLAYTVYSSGTTGKPKGMVSSLRKSLLFLLSIKTE